MKSISVGEFKSQFSEVIGWVKAGEEIQVTFGKQKEVIGIFGRPKKSGKRKFGQLKGKIKISDDFQLTSEEEFPCYNRPRLNL